MIGKFLNAYYSPSHIYLLGLNTTSIPTSTSLPLASHFLNCRPEPHPLIPPISNPASNILTFILHHSAFVLLRGCLFETLLFSLDLVVTQFLPLPASPHHRIPFVPSAPPTLQPQITQPTAPNFFLSRTKCNATDSPITYYLFFLILSIHFWIKKFHGDFFCPPSLKCFPCCSIRHCLPTLSPSLQHCHHSHRPIIIFIFITRHHSSPHRYL